MLNEYVEKLVKELDLPKSVGQDVGGKYTIAMDDETDIVLSDVPPGLSLFALVVEVPDMEKERFLQYVMHGNLLGQGTDGAILGMDQDGKYLTLGLDIEYALSYNEFEEVLERFFNTVEFWREEALLHKKGKLFT